MAARSSDQGCLISGFCSSGRDFVPRFLQTVPRGSALALHSCFTSIRLHRGLSPPDCRTCPAHSRVRLWRTQPDHRASPQGGCHPRALGGSAASGRFAEGGHCAAIGNAEAPCCVPAPEPARSRLTGTGTHRTFPVHVGLARVTTVETTL